MFFETEAARQKHIDQMVEARKKAGAAPALTAKEAEEYRAIKLAIGTTPWVEVVTAWRKQASPEVRMSVIEAVTAYLDHSKKLFERNEIAKQVYAYKVQKLTLFKASFGDVQLSQLTGDAIEGWIEDLGFESAYTFNSYRKVLRAFFAHFKRVVPVNPVDDVDLHDDGVDNVEVLTVAQTKTLFDYVFYHKPELLGRLSLEAFAGLRFSSAFRLEKADINFTDKGVTLPRHKLKTNRRHYIDGLPENLWPWLAATNDACWTLGPHEYRHAKSEAFTKAKVPHPRNCLRHSFCTYHVAAYKNPGLTARILCHRGQQMMYDHYLGRATNADGLAYFGILPPPGSPGKPPVL